MFQDKRLMLLKTTSMIHRWFWLFDWLQYYKQQLTMYLTTKMEIEGDLNDRTYEFAVFIWKKRAIQSRRQY